MACKFRRSCDSYSDTKIICKYGGYKCPIWKERVNGRDKRNLLRDMILESERVWKNCVRLHNKNESKDHFMKKAETCYELRRQGMDFWTEPKLKKYSNCKPDILAANQEEIVGIEILKSETRASFLKKLAKYPKEVHWKAIKA